jgi:hypothetical protein
MMIFLFFGRKEREGRVIEGSDDKQDETATRNKTRRRSQTTN